MNRRAGFLAALMAAAILMVALRPVPKLVADGQGNQPSGFRIASAAFRSGSLIPGKYTCSGANVSPALAWGGPPAGTKSFVLIVVDPDAPGGTWTHWIVYNLPAQAQRLREGVPKTGQIEGGAMQGTSSFQEIGYGGPCPPPGRPHHYHFKLYALNARLNLRSGATRGEVERSMKGHVLAETELIGLYRR
ncbi:MAG: YbhB/YbcL family Raf kinase inhibitor-like protein [Terriglobia bacterium]